MPNWRNKIVCVYNHRDAMQALLRGRALVPAIPSPVTTATYLSLGSQFLVDQDGNEVDLSQLGNVFFAYKSLEQLLASRLRWAADRASATHLEETLATEKAAGQPGMNLWQHLLE